MQKIKDFLKEVDVLVNNVPSLWVSFFFLSVVGMNLLANKSIDMKVDWLALDSAFLFSWLSFLTMDVITKRFGPRASIIISVLALLANLLCAFVFFLASVIPGNWSKPKKYTQDEFKNNTVLNTAIDESFDESFGGTWYIIVGSSAAYLSSSIINNLLNWLIGKWFKGNPDGFVAFALRSYVSTAIGQFVDNFVFASIVSLHFFDWSVVQCITASITKMIAELLFEIIFSPIGYVYLKHMEKENIGKQYIDLYLQEEQEQKKPEPGNEMGNLLTELNTDNSNSENANNENQNLE